MGDVVEMKQDENIPSDLKVVQVSPTYFKDLIGGGVPPINPDGFWDSSSVAPMSNYKGVVDSQGHDVLGQTGQIPAGDFGTFYNTVGAGPGVYDKVGYGNFTWDGSETTLTLVPGELEAQLIYGYAGAQNPDTASGDSVNFIPEPATMSLLVLGGIAALIRRKK